MRKGKQFYLKTNLIGFIVGTIIFGGVAVYAAVTFPSNDVSYDNTNSGLSSTNVKGAIDELYKTCTATTADQIIKKKKKDPYECRYFFTGATPNNYITFNNETWRIISAECDGTIKIIKDNSIGNIQWDEYNDNHWTYPSSLNKYLNETYYNELSATAKNQIVSYRWSIGDISNNIGSLTDIEEQINDENSSKWESKIALPTVSEYIRTNSDKNNCNNFYNDDQNYQTCRNTNWLYDGSISYWTLTASSADSEAVYMIASSFASYNITLTNSDKENIGVRPTLYLSSDLKLSGTGTESDPYIIK